MNLNALKFPIRVSVLLGEPLLYVGACCALRNAPGIALIDHDGMPSVGVDVLVVDTSALPTLGRHLADGAYAHARILVVAASAGKHAIHSALRQGIHGIMSSKSGVEDLISGIKIVASGNTYLCQTLALQLIDPSENDVLTARENDVLQLLALGLCNKSIGRRLDIATGTVKFHVKSIMVKLNAATRTAAASIAISRGLTEHFSLALPKVVDGAPPRAQVSDMISVSRHSSATAPVRRSSTGNLGMQAPSGRPSPSPRP